MSFRGLLPDDVVVVEADLDADWTGSTLPEEQALAAAASPDRALDLLAGRGCARAALEEAGLPAPALLVGPERAPMWPDGVVGSITHAAGLVAAAVGRSSSYTAIGIDIERRGPLADSVTELVLPTSFERDLLVPFGEDATVFGFSAKESVYKAVSPVAGWLEHSDVVLVGASPDTFRAEVARAGIEVSGRWMCDGRVVRTAVVRQGAATV